MSEKDNLQKADGIKELEKTEISDAPETKVDSEIEEKPENEPAEITDTTETSQDSALDEIDSNNAKEAEEETHDQSEKLEEKDYGSMSMEQLVEEIKTLLRTQPIQKIKKPVESIKSVFNKQFGQLLEEKKKQFLDEGGNSIDFQFNFPLKSEFNAHYKDFREKRQAYYKNLENTLQTNLENRLEIIEEIKGLLNVEENINTTYKHFKALQERWRNAGPIPRDKYNNIWNNYHHHVENFYDFLHLNRDLRELDFKHNLERKEKIIARAEELASEPDINRAFRELQALHKMWKEELGPVAREFRESVWERFKNATKAIHDRRQEYFQELDQAYLKNLEVKQAIIDKIDSITESANGNHSGWQKKIKDVEALRQEFFNAGKVPIKVNEATWAKFKESVRAFNRKKNAFYKSLKREQYDNLKKKMELIEIAEAHKDSTDFSAATPVMKKIQSDWKAIGHVPRKDSDVIWNRFKAACNHYFNRLHEHRNTANEEEVEALNKKAALLDSLKDVKLAKDNDKNLELINNKVDEWKSIGKLPFNKRHMEGKFKKVINALYNKLDMAPEEIDMLKFARKIETFSEPGNKHLLDNEMNFIRKKIDEIRSEINQLENNLQFFSNVEDDNPLVKEVHDKISRQHNALEVWEKKHKKIKKFY